MLIHNNFLGGNIEVKSIDGNTVYLANELRDTREGEDWFYWAFCVEGAEGKTVTFDFMKHPHRIGYYGPAVSHDLEAWEWLGAESVSGSSFTYTFKEGEKKVYFAHSMLYHPKRFAEFAERNGLEIKELCKSRKGRSVPFVIYGEGSRAIFLTARHHACESTGSYVLEGVLEGLLNERPADTKIICVPFVDYDGVVDGDQGKARAPYDHNRDYDPDEVPLYPETAKIRELADGENVLYSFDFHSPWHMYVENDNVFAVRKKEYDDKEYDKFGTILESLNNEKSLKYYLKNDHPWGVTWNSGISKSYATYMFKRGADISFTLETTYFGTPDNIFNQKNSVELGKNFAKAIIEYGK